MVIKDTNSSSDKILQKRERQKLWDKKRWADPHRRELMKLYRKKWVEQNKEKVLVIDTRYRIKHKVIICERVKRYYRNLRLRLFDILGDRKCLGCGETEFSKLRFDHKNGGGVKEYRYFGKSANMYRYYVSHPEEAKAKLQPLCMKCNILKGVLTNEEFFIILNYRKRKNRQRNKKQ
jgi:hypothetical protein